MNQIKNNLLEAQKMLDEFIRDEQEIRKIGKAGEMMVKAILAGNKIISCGNGGSMCDAIHFAEEMTGQFRDRREALPAISISDASHLTCTANDYGFESVFSRYIEAIGQHGDVLLVISTSGNSENVIRAAQVSKEKGIMVVGLTGKDGGKLADLCDVEIRSPNSKYSDRAQEIHIKVIHCLIDYIETRV